MPCKEDTFLYLCVFIWKWASWCHKWEAIKRFLLHEKEGRKKGERDEQFEHIKKVQEVLLNSCKFMFYVHIPFFLLLLFSHPFFPILSFHLSSDDRSIKHQCNVFSKKQHLHKIFHRFSFLFSLLYLFFILSLALYTSLVFRLSSKTRNVSNRIKPTFVHKYINTPLKRLSFAFAIISLGIEGGKEEKKKRKNLFFSRKKIHPREYFLIYLMKYFRRERKKKWKKSERENEKKCSKIIFNEIFNVHIFHVITRGKYLHFF